MTSVNLSAEDIFSEAITRPAAERMTYVRQVCGDQRDIYEEVESLIGHHEKGDFILDRSPVVWPADDNDAPIAERCGDTIGRYRLLEKIGEGGMGVVYMAEQTTDVRRRVALKIIKLGMDTRQVMARFEAEQQAMAMFDHPNITQVFDAGATTSGRPYFVMELVRGTNIMEYVKRCRLSLEQRLKIFVDVCKAIQHAHQKGIIHRDLKPSNILITHVNETAAAKVIDFGIAKAMGQQRLTDKTLFTRHNAMVGTPQYMSPEQADMNGSDIDTRSDIYSLGVLLYELMTGTTPISLEKLEGLHPQELSDTLRDTHFETPSMRIARSARSLSGSDRAPKLDSMAAELDWVIMKALSPDRSARYASANEFASDVIRYMDREPVLAAPPSRLRHLQSYLRRYRKSLAMAAVMTLVLVGATVTCSVFAFRAHRVNEELANANEQLQEHINRVELAEKQVREVVDDKLFAAAHDVVLTRFHWHFGSIMSGLAHEIATEMSRTASAQGIFLGPLDDELDPSELFCFGFDETDLLDLSLASELEQPLRRLKTTIEQNDRVWNRALSDQMEAGECFDGDFDEESEHSRECLMLQTKIGQALQRERPEFYRMVVSEYRSVFGEADSRVADALHLLAASLVDREDWDEAESHLREAKAIGDSSQQELSRQLIRQVQELRSTKSSKRARAK